MSWLESAQCRNFSISLYVFPAYQILNSQSCQWYLPYEHRQIIYPTLCLLNAECSFCNATLSSLNGSLRWVMVGAFLTVLITLRSPSLLFLPPCVLLSAHFHNASFEEVTHYAS